MTKYLIAGLLLLVLIVACAFVLSQLSEQDAPESTSRCTIRGVLPDPKCTPGAIAEELRAFLDDPSRARALRDGLGGVRAQLCGDGAFDRAAAAVLEEAGRSPV